MRKLTALLAGLFAIHAANAQPDRKLDQPMEIKNCHIKITANAFVAKTFIEIEFYNNQPNEIEGVQYFTLNEGQIITAFQLDLNGKYRDGSIEEKWKANNAYNSIVGKRVDPALLQMTYNNNYRLNIYPFAPKSARRITMTIVQILKDEKDGLKYDLPIKLTDSIEKLHVEIDVEGKLQLPVAKEGLLEGTLFSKSGTRASLAWTRNNTPINKNIHFIIPVLEDEYHFFNAGSQNNGFALRLFSNVPNSFATLKNKLAIFWDGSASSVKRNIEKEISYLGDFIANNQINDIEFYVFTNQVQQYRKFDLATQNISEIKDFISTIKYAGTTNLGSVDLSAIKTDIALVFSDGIQSSGNGTFKEGACLVNCIVSGENFDAEALKNICSNSGGRIINLHSGEYKTDALLSGNAANMLFYVGSEGQKPVINETLPIRSTYILITGKYNNNAPLHLKFGNNIHTGKEYFLSPNSNVDSSLDSYKIIELVRGYEKVKEEWNWHEMLLFGLENKIVTERTAYIVLEKTEDYIKYKIAPPKELEEQCAQMNYVYNSQYRRAELKEYSEVQEMLQLLAGLNKKINWWNAAASSTVENIAGIFPINKDRGKNEISKDKNNQSAIDNTPIQNTGGNTISEVVITSAFSIKRTARSVSSSVQYIYGQELSTIREANIGNALAGKVAGLQVQSQSYAALGRSTNLRLRGENGFGVGAGVIYVVDGHIMKNNADINPDDIEYISVLQGPAATALFGAEAANGALVINSKKGRRQFNGYGYYQHFQKYKLSDMADVDYLETMKNTEDDHLSEQYEKLKKHYVNSVAFYFDIADLFFERKMRKEAILIMEDGIEMCNGVDKGKRAAAYQYEKWREFDRAIQLYKEIIELNAKDIEAMRELALCYYQNRQYQLALNMYHQGLTTEISEYNDIYFKNIKQTMLHEMNALIATRRIDLDLGNIDSIMIVSLPADIYLSAESNWNQNLPLSVTSPSRFSYTFNKYSNDYMDQSKPADTTGYQYLSDGNLTIFKAGKGRYKISQASYNYYHSSIPIYTRIILFKNFQRANQEIEIQTIQMDNQYGQVEIGYIHW